MFQAIKSAVKSNGAVNMLKDDGLYDAVRNLNSKSAKQSQLTTVDKAMKNAKSAKEYNEALASGASKLSERATKAGTGSMKGSALAERVSVMETAQNKARGMSESAFQEQRTKIKSGDYKKQRSQAISDELNPASKGVLSATKGYFTTDDMMTNAVRAGAVAGALGTAAVGGRCLSGGSATVNNRGERDIAGIPFV